MPIKIQESLKSKAEETARVMRSNNVFVSDIQGAEGMVLIQSGSGYECPSNSVFQTKIVLNEGDFWLCEGSAKVILAQKE